MTLHIDGSVFPDQKLPQEFFTQQQKADYLHRLIGAFDFGLPPDAATLRLLSGWQDVFDAYPLPSSSGYHALRSYFGWPPVAKAPFPMEPAYLRQDSLEERVDGFEECV